MERQTELGEGSASFLEVCESERSVPFQRANVQGLTLMRVCCKHRIQLAQLALVQLVTARRSAVSGPCHFCFTQLRNRDLSSGRRKYKFVTDDQALKRVFGVNSPRHLCAKVRMHDLKNVSDTEPAVSAGHLNKRSKPHVSNAHASVLASKSVWHRDPSLLSSSDFAPAPSCGPLCMLGLGLQPADAGCLCKH